MKETAYNHIDNEPGFFSSDEKKWINKILKLAESNPDDVVIVRMPETNDGCICAKVPQSWFKISPPRKTNMSDERKAQLANRLAQARQKQKDGVDNA